jgi:hypothetical protein
MGFAARGNSEKRVDIFAVFVSFAGDRTASAFG